MIENYYLAIEELSIQYYSSRKIKNDKKRTGMRNLSLKTILYSIYFYSTMGLERFSNKGAKITRSKLEHDQVWSDFTFLATRILELCLKRGHLFISNEWFHLIYWERIEIIVIFSSLFYKISLLFATNNKGRKMGGSILYFRVCWQTTGSRLILSIRWSIEKPISNC